MSAELRGYLDEAGRVTAWPSRRNRNTMRRAVLGYLAERFEPNRMYREPEVNDLLRAWHTFDDHALLRRELCDGGFLVRTLDGSEYRRLPQPSGQE